MQSLANKRILAGRAGRLGSRRIGAIVRSSGPTQQEAPIHGSPASAGPQELPDDLVLKGVRVVLVAPKGSTNIGAVARVCANFEVPNLYVVAPRCDPRGLEATNYATGAAKIILESQMKVVDSLAEALADTSSSVGFTRRAGSSRRVAAHIAELLSETPSAIPQAIRQAPPQQQHQQQQGEAAAAAVMPLPDEALGVTALVFGREESGLTEEELRLCTHACSLPSGRIQPSLNLSHAAGVVLYEIFQRRTGIWGSPQPTNSTSSSAPSAPTTTTEAAPQPLSHEQASQEAAQQQAQLQSVHPSLRPAKQAEVDSLIQRLGAIADAVGIGSASTSGGSSHGRRMKPMGHVRAVLGRARLLAGEVRGMHGLASAVMDMLSAAAGTGSGAGDKAGTGQAEAGKTDAVALGSDK